MIHDVPVWLTPLDHAVLAMLAPVAAAILISGIDDLVIDLVWLAAWIHRKLRRKDLLPPTLESTARRSIAIVVPLWQEHEVIARMLEHNLASIRYDDYDIFAGAYPNDDLTQDAVRQVSDRFSKVHLALCPHDGPTSKADCLNWIWHNVQLYEEQRGRRFDLIVVHDAEDLIHPDELAWVNDYSARFDFIQTPVLALATPWWDFTHGVYCDEFAEYHTRDMPVRPVLGGFVPSAGVGTAYRRGALERLAAERSDRLFEPESLTEDYESGLQLFRLGCRQAFVPLRRAGREGDFVATREYFPRSFRAALRQRTRWVMGNALQTWERYGWGRSLAESYWLWRDRKGLITSPMGFAANAIFVYGLLTGMWHRATLSPRLVFATAAIALVRIAVRAACVARVYGAWFALGVPMRAVYANALNACAVSRALILYVVARLRRHPLRWVKTAHSFPGRTALLANRRMLGEILTASGHLNAEALDRALATKPESARIGEHLLRSRLISERALYEALSLQQGLPFSRVDPATVPRAIARAIPDQVARKWRVMPFQVAEGALFLASSEAPPAGLAASLRAFTALEIRVHLVTPSNFNALRNMLLA